MDNPDVVVQWEVEETLEGRVDRGFLEGVVREALSRKKLGGLLSVGLTITDDEGIRELNREHRGLDRATDVLSFPMQQYDAPEKPSVQFPHPPGEPLPLGDVVVSYPRAEEQAHSYGHSLQRELAFLVVHGIMHLLGYDHEVAADAERMRAEEEVVLARLGLTR